MDDIAIDSLRARSPSPLRKVKRTIGYQQVDDQEEEHTRQSLKRMRLEDSAETGDMHN